jgi:malate dehydrogenase (quinone)
MTRSSKKTVIKSDVALIGAGIMSATLGTLLKELKPDVSIYICERLAKEAEESSDPWNNAGTGHSALCELNYTPQDKDGKVHIDKALSIMEDFEVSKQFWSHLVKQNKLSSPKDFIRTVPHMSFVMGEKNVNYLRTRYEALQQHDLFKGMDYSEDPEQIKAWAPLIVEGRDSNEKVAATYTKLGTDVNFGMITTKLIQHLQEHEDVQVSFETEVQSLKRKRDGTWLVTTKDLRTKKEVAVSAKFVFIGAGGGSLQLLQESGIPESKKYGGFPVGGQWLVCTNTELAEHHFAKVYGQAEVGAPPMSVPHLDTRIIDGKRALLFGPFATFSTKFLKEGSYLDLFGTLKFWNIFPMIKVGVKNLDLEKYLIKQLRLSFDDRVDVLRKFYPNAKNFDWSLREAGQRVQVIKNDPVHGGVLQFGTEVVTSADGTLATVLGASPGASTAVSIMLDLVEKCFSNRGQEILRQKLKAMVPSYKQSLAENKELMEEMRNYTSSTLELDWVQPTCK